MEYPGPRSRIIAALCITLSGCASALTDGDPVTESITNRGVIAVEPRNPFLAVNKFLKAEMTQSPELAGFLNLKGYPTSLELKDGSFSTPLLTLYYNDTAERYDLTPSGETWIISGPFKLAQGEIPAAPTPPPPFRSPDRPEPNERKAEKKESKPVPITPVPVIQPAPKPTPALTISEQPLAEISPRGDLVHYVTMQGETLSIIARWYTEDRENAPKLARLNRLKSSDVLSLGDTIIIPSYMIKNKVRLTEESLRKMQQVAEDAQAKKTK